MDGQYAFRDQRGLARICIGFLLAQAALAAFGALSDYSSYASLGGLAAEPPIDDDDATTHDALAALVAMLQTLLYIIGGACILTWICHANRNARAIGTLEMEVTPGWAVGWFFVPFLNLFMPFRAVREIWAASRSALPSEPPPPMGLLPGWWLAWIATNLTGLIALRIAFEYGDEPGMRRTAAAFDVASNVTMVPACLLLAAIIAGIQSLQNRGEPAN